MNIPKGSASGILQALCDVVTRASVYSSVSAKIEVERLFWLGTGFDTFLEKVASTGQFTSEPSARQNDFFFDLNHGGRWLLAETDHYVRIREQRGGDDTLLSAELKVAYPGLPSNPNARPAVDQPLTELEVGKWRDILAAFDLKLERRYKKRRVLMRSTAALDDLLVELEADRFDDDPSNGRLANKAFVSISVEIAAKDYELAISALEQALEVLGSCGICLVECDGNYESFFYGRLPLPTLPLRIDDRTGILGSDSHGGSLRNITDTGP